MHPTSEIKIIHSVLSLNFTPNLKQYIPNTKKKKKAKKEKRQKKSKIHIIHHS